MPELHKVYIAFGGNVGDVASYFSSAHKMIEALPDTCTVMRSHLYLTSPWGVIEQNDFINACLALDTGLPPHALLSHCLEIERAHGRDRSQTIKWGPRPLDIDLLHYESLELQTAELVLPHPEIFNRAFVLIPFAEIAPEIIIGGKNIGQAARLCDAAGVTQLAQAW